MNSFGLIFDSDNDGNSRALCVYYLFLIKIGIDFMLTYTGVSCNLNSFCNLNRFWLFKRELIVYQLRMCIIYTCLVELLMVYSHMQNSNQMSSMTEYKFLLNMKITPRFIISFNTRFTNYQCLCSSNTQTTLNKGQIVMEAAIPYKLTYNVKNKPTTVKRNLSHQKYLRIEVRSSHYVSW